MAEAVQPLDRKGPARSTGVAVQRFTAGMGRLELHERLVLTVPNRA